MERDFFFISKHVTSLSYCEHHVMMIYSRAMKTQRPNVHQYLKDKLNILLEWTSGDFMNTKDRQHIDFISLNVKCSNVYTHAHIPTVVE